MAMLVFIFCAVLHIALAGPDFGRKCKPGERGSPGIKYFLDSERHNLPYPFRYLGCGGARLHFATKNMGLLMGRVDACNGFSKSAGHCGGMELFQSEKQECPDGHYCVMGPFNNGMCCNQAISDRYNENRKALQCPKGTKPYKDPEDKTSIFFGRSCEHNFCPKYSTCVHEEFEAYCCVCNGARK